MARAQDEILLVFYGEPRMRGRPRHLRPRDVAKEIRTVNAGSCPNRNLLGNGLRGLENLGLIRRTGSHGHPYYTPMSRPNLLRLKEYLTRREHELDVWRVLFLLGLAQGPGAGRLARRFRPLVEQTWFSKVKPPHEKSILVSSGIPGAYQVGRGSFWNLNEDELARFLSHILEAQEIWRGALDRMAEEALGAARVDELQGMVRSLLDGQVSPRGLPGRLPWKATAEEGRLMAKASTEGTFWLPVDSAASLRAMQDVAFRFPRALILTPRLGSGGLPDLAFEQVEGDDVYTMVNAALRGDHVDWVKEGGHLRGRTRSPRPAKGTASPNKATKPRTESTRRDRSRDARLGEKSRGHA